MWIFFFTSLKLNKYKENLESLIQNNLIGCQIVLTSKSLLILLLPNFALRISIGFDLFILRLLSSSNCGSVFFCIVDSLLGTILLTVEGIFADTGLFPVAGGIVETVWERVGLLTTETAFDVDFVVFAWDEVETDVIGFDWAGVVAFVVFVGAFVLGAGDAVVVCFVLIFEALTVVAGALLVAGAVDVVALVFKTLFVVIVVVLVVEDVVLAEVVLILPEFETAGLGSFCLTVLLTGCATELGAVFVVVFATFEVVALFVVVTAFDFEGELTLAAAGVRFFAGKAAFAAGVVEALGITFDVVIPEAVTDDAAVCDVVGVEFCVFTVVTALVVAVMLAVVVAAILFELIVLVGAAVVVLVGAVVVVLVGAVIVVLVSAVVVVLAGAVVVVLVGAAVVLVGIAVALVGFGVAVAVAVEEFETGFLSSCLFATDDAVCNGFLSKGFNIFWGLADIANWGWSSLAWDVKLLAGSFTGLSKMGDGLSAARVFVDVFKFFVLRSSKSDFVTALGSLYESSISLPAAESDFDFCIFKLWVSCNKKNYIY